MYYNKALALVGSASPAIGALLSAHQSIGVPQPLKLFGTQEQKEHVPAALRPHRHHAPSCSPSPTSAPTRPGCATTAVPDGDDYVLDGVKLWTTNGVVADLLVVMARVPKSEGHKGGITAFVVEADSAGHHRREPQRLHGPARHRERRHPLPPGPGPGREPHRPRGRRA